MAKQRTLGCEFVVLGRGQPSVLNKSLHILVLSSIHWKVCIANDKNSTYFQKCLLRTYFILYPVMISRPTAKRPRFQGLKSFMKFLHLCSYPVPPGGSYIRVSQHCGPHTAGGRWGNSVTSLKRLLGSSYYSRTHTHARKHTHTHVHTCNMVDLGRHEVRLLFPS